MGASVCWGRGQSVLADLHSTRAGVDRGQAGWWWSSAGGGAAAAAAGGRNALSSNIGWTKVDGMAVRSKHANENKVWI